ncbi:hypothetical protein LXL04_039385 [Taraxacum kok-saghyz]
MFEGADELVAAFLLRATLLSQTLNLSCGRHLVQQRRHQLPPSIPCAPARENQQDSSDSERETRRPRSSQPYSDHVYSDSNNPPPVESKLTPLLLILGDLQQQLCARGAHAATHDRVCGVGEKDTMRVDGEADIAFSGEEEGRRRCCCVTFSAQFRQPWRLPPPAAATGQSTTTGPTHLTTLMLRTDC